jgi:hypothetical protein
MIDVFKAFLADFDYNSKWRGQLLYKTEQVSGHGLVNGTYSCLVHGDTGDYETYVTLDRNGKVLDYGCECAYFASGHKCKHLYATVLSYDDYLRSHGMTKKAEPIPEHELMQAYEPAPTSKYERIVKSFAKTGNSSNLDQKNFDKIFDTYKTNPELIAKLIGCVRKEYIMEFVVSFLERHIDLCPGVFQSKEFGNMIESMPFRPLIAFLKKHSKLLQYMDESCMDFLFKKKYQKNAIDRSAMLFLCLHWHNTMAIKSFFRGDENSLTFMQDVRLIDYLRKNEKPSVWLDVFEDKIKNFTLTRMQAGFLYPYFSDETKSRMDIFFKDNDSASHRYYFSYVDYDQEYYYIAPMNRSFYYLLVANPSSDAGDYNLKTMYYLREKIFSSSTDPNMIKRFKVLVSALARTRNPTFDKAYCCARILVEYCDKDPNLSEIAMKFLTSEGIKSLPDEELIPLREKIEEECRFMKKNDYLVYEMEA